MKHDDFSILICSHSKAADLWSITHYFFQKYWSNCSFPVYLGANGENKQDQCPNQWHYINKGLDETWSKSVLSYLDAIPTRYVILWLDDFIPLKPIEQSFIDEAVNFVKNNHPVMLRLTPNPKGDILFNTLFDKIDVKNKVPYVTSLQIAIWDKSFLMSLLSYGFTPWEFEIKAGKVLESMKYSDDFYCASRAFIDYTHYVEKGKLYPFIYELLSDENITLPNLDRHVLSQKELQDLQKHSWFKKLLYLCPPKYINKIRKICGKHEL